MIRITPAVVRLNDSSAENTAVKNNHKQFPRSPSIQKFCHLKNSMRVTVHMRFHYRWFSLSRNEKIIRELFSGLSQKMLLYRRWVKKYISPSFGSLCVPKLQIFVEVLCANLQSLVWSSLLHKNTAARK